MFVQHQTVHIFRVDSEEEIVSHVFSPSGQNRLPGFSVYCAYKETTFNLLQF